MTRIITENPTIEHLDQFAKTVTQQTAWIGDEFGINLSDLLQYARDGLKQRDENIAYGDEMEREEIYDGWEENYYALQLEGRAYGPHNPICGSADRDESMGYTLDDF